MTVGHERTATVGTMRDRTQGLLIHTIVLLAFALLVTPAHAQTLPVAPTKAVQLDQVTNIRETPLAILAKFPKAGPAMARFVAKELVAQPNMVDALLSILNDTTPEQASAIGAGMVRAVRAMGGKDPATTRSFSEKVARTDNMWLKTTYGALGPNYRGANPAALPRTLPPRIFADGVEMGTGAGNQWRVGPVENENYTARGANATNELGTDKKCAGYTGNYVAKECRGMIVAIITSDAEDNGAVSTSPTI